MHLPELSLAQLPHDLEISKRKIIVFLRYAPLGSSKQPLPVFNGLNDFSQFFERQEANVSRPVLG
jgi:hypothetical protein